MGNIKLIALDLDGTLFNSDGEISAKDRETLKIEKDRVIEVCKRMNYIMTINVKNILKLFYCISSE